MRVISIGLVLILSICSSAWGMERFEIVTTYELKQLLDDREAGIVDFILVNALDALIYEHHHIPGSINLPLHRVSDALSVLGKPKDRMIIIY